MAFQQNFDNHNMHFQSEEDISNKQKWNSLSQVAASLSSENPNECFDCNICFDSSHDPVVTLCGHLYCWPCIYRWLQVQSSSSFESDTQQPKCPVCKSHISTSSLVPLYGRGTSLSDTDTKKLHLDLTIPRRPPAVGVTSLTNQQNHEQYFSPAVPVNYTSMTRFGGTTTTPTNILSPTTVNMVGELVYARMFGSWDTSLFADHHYSLMGNGSSRLRRQELQWDKSLNRVFIFLLCCFVLCLVLF